MYTAFAAMALFSAMGVLMLVIGARVLIGGIRMAVWMLTTKAGWITAGLLFVAYLLFW